MNQFIIKLNSLNTLSFLAIYFLFQVTCFSLSGIDGSTQERIIQLVKTNPGQLSLLEYSLIAEVLQTKTPCNMLVFGVGKDSSLWMDLNKEGFTLFLESDPKWLDFVKTQSKDIQAHLIDYDTRRSDWKELLYHKSEHSLELNNLPECVSKTSWDIIFIDGPPGYDETTPGRMKSIYTAAKLAWNNHGCHIFVHDCDRLVEAIYSDFFFKEINLVCTVDRLRYYDIP